MVELFIPNDIALDDVSLEMIEDVEETARKVSEYRPLPDDVIDRIQAELLGPRVFSSNAIEGSTLGLRETITVLKTGHVDIARKREALEARNLGRAIEAISALVPRDTSCYGADALLRIHGIVLGDIDETWAGRYRTDRVMIDGATHQPPDHVVVPSLVDRMMATLAEPGGESGLLRAVWAHWAIARIHPFRDGNGRMARLWQDLVLFRENLTCAIIRPEDRNDYLNALASADEGEFNPLVQLIAQRVVTTFDPYLTELTKHPELEEWAAELAKDASLRSDQSHRMMYLRWSRKMEELRHAFELCAATLNESSQGVSVQVRRHPLIDQQCWENIRSGMRADRTWFLRIDLQRERRYLKYFLFFGRHLWSAADTDEDRLEQRVSLLASESESGRDARRVEHLEGSPIGLREVFVVDNGFVQKRWDRDTQVELNDRQCTAVQIAKEFINDVILRRLC